MTSTTFFGVDVSKDDLHLGDTATHIRSVKNNAKGFQQIIEIIQEHAGPSVTVEATGIYSSPLAAALISANIPVAIVQPRRVHYFAKAANQLAKTDILDCVMIARFAEKMNPRRFEFTSENRVDLRALVDRRGQIADDLAREKTRLEGCAHERARSLIKEQIDHLKTTMSAIEKEINEAILVDETLQESSAKLRDVHGVGLVTSATLLAHLPELGQVNRAKIAALAGLAPYDRSSGDSDLKRSIYGGRQRVRRVLYMATIAAIRGTGIIATAYKNLRLRGKPAKVAIIACARKLLIHLNSIMNPTATAVGA